MLNIYSKNFPSVLLHVIVRKEEIAYGRTDVTLAEMYIQLSCHKENAGKNCPPHRHKEQHRTSDITQETWIVISGGIRLSFYDLDGSFLQSTDLYAGDLAATFRGGHGLEVIEDNTIFYEHKNGPYTGKAMDKEFI